MPYKDPTKKRAFDRMNRKRTAAERLQYNVDYRGKNPRVVRDIKLRHDYGITIEDVKRMYISQNGVCAICLQKFKSRKDMHVDHNHTTGQVRQLLCQQCNSGIGALKENPLLFDRAREYITKWNQ